MEGKFSEVPTGTVLCTSTVDKLYVADGNVARVYEGESDIFEAFDSWNCRRQTAVSIERNIVLICHIVGETKTIDCFMCG